MIIHKAYPDCMKSPCGSEDYELGEDELESALKLATLWVFEAVRNIAIKKIEALSMESTRIIHLAQLYHVDHWVTPEIERLALRTESLTVEELKQVGWDVAAEIYAYRDMKSHLAVQMSKEHVSVKDMDLMHSCISKHIRKQRQESDGCAFDDREPLAREGESLKVESVRAFGNELDEVNQGGCVPAKSETTILRRPEVQKALALSQADRSALDVRIASLQTKLKVIEDEEKKSGLRFKVASIESEVDCTRSMLFNAQIALATIVMNAANTRLQLQTQTSPFIFGTTPINPRVEHSFDQVNAENLIRSHKTKLEDAERRLKEAKGCLQ